MNIPVQLNYVSGGDLGDRTLGLHFLQPSVPLPLSKKITLLSRTVVPIVNLPLPDGSRQLGLLDTQEQLFVMRSEPRFVSLGIGPTIPLPTGTTPVRSGQWGLGPGILLVVPLGPFTLAGLANHVFRVSPDNGRAKLSLFSFQPFLTLALGKGWSVVSSPLLLANYGLEKRNRWTVPLGLGVGKVVSIGAQLLSLSVHYYRDVIYPDGFGADQVRIQCSFWYFVLMPKGA